MYHIEILESAVLEIEQAALWYAKENEDLQNRFIAVISAAIDKLQSDKIIHGAVIYGLSRIFVKGFPYIIYFTKNKDRNQIIIYGVLHAKQSKSQLDERI